MQINTLTPAYAVAGQIAPEDVPALAQAGFAEVICNRPDEETDARTGSEALRAAVEAAGLGFTYNPVVNGALTQDNVEIQGRVIDDASGPVFAYCRSGMRSSVVWALSRAGREDTDALIEAAARGGYDLAPLRPQIEAQARR